MLSEEIYNGLMLYRNPFPNIDKLYNIILDYDKHRENHPLLIGENSSFSSGHFTEWKDWYGFGENTIAPWYPEIDYDIFIDDEKRNKVLKEYDNKKEILEDDGRYFSNQISKIFYECTLDYIKKYNFSLPDFHKMGISICRYDTRDIDKDGEFAMTYHTDYQAHLGQTPGLKFGLTCTIYLNDNYDGGDICFLDLRENQVIEYKPKAGDVIVFPSGEPYYHGVKQITKGEKYFIRTYWCFDLKPSDEWIAGEKEYGKEEWQKMNTEVIKREFKSGKYHKIVISDESKKTKKEEGFHYHLVDKPFIKKI